MPRRPEDRFFDEMSGERRDAPPPPFIRRLPLLETRLNLPWNSSLCSRGWFCGVLEEEETKCSVK